MVAMLKERRLCEQPLAVLGLNDAALAEATAQRLRSQGWQVLIAGTAAEVRRAAARMAPSIVVLDVDPPDESGWLACAKLQRLRRRPRVILLDNDDNIEGDDFALFVGATGRIFNGINAMELASVIVDNVRVVA
jgi:DNA-binding response OmpR family regulator